MKNQIKILLKYLIPPKLHPWAHTTYTTYKRARYFGLRYKCPICRSLVKTFYPFGLHFPVLEECKVVGGGYRLNALCPVCGSFDRERLLFLYLGGKTNLFARPYRLLHVAPEAALKKVLRSKSNIDYVTADLSAPDVMIKINLTNIPFPDHSFDAIICNHVLEHITDDRKAMAELYRVLKPLGWAVLQVPISPSLESTYEDPSIMTEEGREQAFGQADHVRIYGQDYKTRLEQTGFKVDIFNWSSEIFDFGGSKNLFGLIKDERVYLARRM